MFFIWIAILEEQIAGKYDIIKHQKLITIIWTQVGGEGIKMAFLIPHQIVSFCLKNLDMCRIQTCVTRLKVERSSY